MLRTMMLLTLLASTAHADPITVGSLTIEDVHSYDTPPTARTAAGYFTVSNTGDENDVLVAVEAGFPRVEIHASEMTDGVMSMHHVERLEIPAGDTITLEPGGLHVMFMGLDGKPFEVGATVPATLVFDRAGPVAVEFEILDHKLRGKAHDH